MNAGTMGLKQKLLLNFAAEMQCYSKFNYQQQPRQIRQIYRIAFSGWQKAAIKHTLNFQWKRQAQAAFLSLPADCCVKPKGSFPAALFPQHSLPNTAQLTRCLKSPNRSNQEEQRPAPSLRAAEVTKPATQEWVIFPSVFCNRALPEELTPNSSS